MKKKVNNSHLQDMVMLGLENDISILGKKKWNSGIKDSYLEEFNGDRHVFVGIFGQGMVGGRGVAEHVPPHGVC